MSRKTSGYILIALGIILLLVSLAADSLGLGAVPGFGWKQLVGALIGVLALLAGGWLSMRKPS